MTQAQRRAWPGIAWVAALVFAGLAASAWVRPLMLPDEGRYVGVGWEMLRSGEWLTPTLNGLPYFHKPPLFYWITAASLSVFGPHEWAARAAPLLGAWLAAMALILFAQRWASRRVAGLAAVALVAQPLFLLGGQFSNLDMLVAGCITATTLLLADAALRLERALPYRRVLTSAFAMAALGVLAKGLIGVVIPALVIGTWLIARRRWRVLGALFWPPGLLVFLLIAVPWFAVMQTRFDGFLDYFFVVQHFKRFAAGGFNNVQPFWFYPAVLLLFSLPWSPWLARQWTQRATLNASDGAVRLLMSIWVGVVVLFFSLPQSKLLGYVLPAVPPLAFLIADGFDALGIASTGSRRLWIGAAALGALLSIGVVVGLAVWPRPDSRELAAALLAQRAPAEPVFMLGDYHFDLPFYARLDQPVGVVEDWSAQAVSRRDNWRKELADAATFAPRVASTNLLSPAALAGRLCQSPVSWVVGHDADAVRFPFLATARRTSTKAGPVLWRVERSLAATAAALGCQGTPSGGPEGR